MPMPPDGREWTHVSPDGSRWYYRSAPDGSIPVPAEFARTDSDLLSVVGGLVGLKLASVRRVEAARAKRAQVNAHVEALIAAGFVYGGQTFSLSAEAQSNLHALKARAATLAWPMDRLNIDDSASVTLANSTAGLAFYTAAMDTIDAHHAQGRTRKQAILTALADQDVAAGLAAIEAIDAAWAP